MKFNQIDTLDLNRVEPSCNNPDCPVCKKNRQHAKETTVAFKEAFEKPWLIQEKEKTMKKQWTEREKELFRMGAWAGEFAQTDTRFSFKVLPGEKISLEKEGCQPLIIDGFDNLDEMLIALRAYREEG